jgi:hypothetical protein
MNQTLTVIALFANVTVYAEYSIYAIIVFNGTLPNENQYELALCRREKRPEQRILNPKNCE